MTRKKPKQESAYGPLKGNPIAGGATTYWKDPHRSLSTYNERSLKAESGLPIRSFKRTKLSSFVQAIDSINYLTVVMNYIKVDSVAAGNGYTAFCKLVEDSFELGYRDANKKDLVADNLTAYKLICSNALQLCYEILTRKTLRSLSNSITESSTTSTSWGTLAPWDINDWDFFLSKIHNYGPVPHWIYALANKLFAKFIKFSDSFAQYKTVFPPSYAMLWTPLYDLAEVEAIRDTMKANRVAAITLMDKFGIPYDAGLNHEILKPIETNIDDVDIRAFFNHVRAIYSYAAATVEPLHPSGDFIGNMTTAYTYRRYYFDDPKPVSMLHALATLLAPYDATNNNYGITASFSPNNDGEWNAIVAAEDDTSFTEANLNNQHGGGIFLHFLGAYQDNVNANLNGNNYRVAIVGDLGGSVHYEEFYCMYWPYVMRDPDIVYGTGIGYNEARANTMNYLLSIMYNNKSRGNSDATKRRTDDSE